MQQSTAKNIITMKLESYDRQSMSDNKKVQQRQQQYNEHDNNQYATIILLVINKANCRSMNTFTQGNILVNNNSMICLMNNTFICI